MDKFIATLLLIVFTCFIFITQFEGDINQSYDTKTTEVTETIAGTSTN